MHKHYHRYTRAARGSYSRDAHARLLARDSHHFHAPASHVGTLYPWQRNKMDAEESNRLPIDIPLEDDGSTKTDPRPKDGSDELRQRTKAELKKFEFRPRQTVPTATSDGKNEGASLRSFGYEHRDSDTGHARVVDSAQTSNFGARGRPMAAWHPSQLDYNMAAMHYPAYYDPHWAGMDYESYDFEGPGDPEEPAMDDTTSEGGFRLDTNTEIRILGTHMWWILLNLRASEHEVVLWRLAPKSVGL
jgi:hypothetical protein